MRAAPEQQMIADIHCMIAAGQDLDWVDAQGATLVSRWAGGPGLGGSVPEPRRAGTAGAQHLVEVKLIQLGPVRGLEPPPDRLWGQGCPWNTE